MLNIYSRTHKKGTTFEGDETMVNKLNTRVANTKTGVAFDPWAESGWFFEKQGGVSGIMIDLDIFQTERRRQLTPKRMQKLVKGVSDYIVSWFDIVEDNLFRDGLYVVLESRSNVKFDSKRNIYKDGIHILIPELQMTAALKETIIRCMVRDKVVENMLKGLNVLLDEDLYPLDMNSKHVPIAFIGYPSKNGVEPHLVTVYTLTEGRLALADENDLDESGCLSLDLALNKYDEEVEYKTIVNKVEHELSAVGKKRVEEYQVELESMVTRYKPTEQQLSKGSAKPQEIFSILSDLIHALPEGYADSTGTWRRAIACIRNTADLYGLDADECLALANTFSEQSDKYKNIEEVTDLYESFEGKGVYLQQAILWLNSSKKPQMKMLFKRYAELCGYGQFHYQRMSFTEFVDYKKLLGRPVSVKNVMAWCDIVLFDHINGGKNRQIATKNVDPIDGCVVYNYSTHKNFLYDNIEMVTLAVDDDFKKVFPQEAERHAAENKEETDTKPVVKRKVVRKVKQIEDKTEDKTDDKTDDKTEDKTEDKKEPMETPFRAMPLGLIVTKLLQYNRISSYNSIINEPYVGDKPDCSANTINLFSGFPHRESTNSPTQFMNSLWFKHIKEELCDNDEAYFTWLMDWVAHMFQSPEEIPGTMPLLISTSQGVGKDMFFSLISSAIGHRYTHSFESMEHFLGEKNGDQEGKLFISLNEINESSGMKTSVVQTLKGIITRDHVRIRKLYHDGSRVKNFARLIGFTNRENALHIEVNDRRIAVKKCSSRMAQNKERFSALHAESSDNDLIASLHNFFVTRTITTDYRTAPMNIYKKEVVAYQLPSAMRFIKEFMESSFNEMMDRDYHRENEGFVDENIFYMKPLELYSKYKDWCVDGNEKVVNRKAFTEIIKRLGVEQVVKKNDGKAHRVIPISMLGMLETFQIYLKNDEFRFEVDGHEEPEPKPVEKPVVRKEKTKTKPVEKPEPKPVVRKVKTKTKTKTKKHIKNENDYTLDKEAFAAFMSR